jgi:hypothetical protein
MTRLITLAFVAAITAAACGGASATVAPTQASGSTGVRDVIDCSLLTPADFAAAGIDGAGNPADNADETGHYCLYAGTSGATGGIEFDIFPHDDVATATETFDVATAEGPQGARPAGATFDQSSFAIDGEVAYLTVRQGTVVFALSVPDGANREAALLGLANLVVQRAGI